MNSILAFFLSFGAPETPAPAMDMQFLKTSTEVRAFCARRFTFEDEKKACEDKALFIGLEKTQACAGFSKVAVDRESCLASASAGTSVEVLRYCAGHEFSMKKVDCLQNQAQEKMSADYKPILTKKLTL